jgi:hypothetical protein
MLAMPLMGLDKAVIDRVCYQTPKDFSACRLPEWRRFAPPLQCVHPRHTIAAGHTAPGRAAWD